MRLSSRLLRPSPIAGAWRRSAARCSMIFTSMPTALRSTTTAQRQEHLAVHRWARRQRLRPALSWTDRRTTQPGLRSVSSSALPGAGPRRRRVDICAQRSEQPAGLLVLQRDLFGNFAGDGWQHRAAAERNISIVAVDICCRQAAVNGRHRAWSVENWGDLESPPSAAPRRTVPSTWWSDAVPRLRQQGATYLPPLCRQRPDCEATTPSRLAAPLVARPRRDGAPPVLRSTDGLHLLPCCETTRHPDGLMDARGSGPLGAH